MLSCCVEKSNLDVSVERFSSRRWRVWCLTQKLKEKRKRSEVAVVAMKMGRCRTRGAEHICTDTRPRDSRRPIFIATLRAVVSRPLFRVARSLRINSDMLVARALKNNLLIRQRPDESYVSYGTGH
jgi:hypothetical protein